MTAQPQQDALLDALWQKGLVLVGERVWQEYGLRTPVFIDLRHKLYDDLDLLLLLGHALHQRIASIVKAEASSRPQQVIGIPDTATPLALAAAVASRGSVTPLRYGQMRKNPPHYPGGSAGGGTYMGTCDPSREITLIDDVMASGATKQWAIEQLASEGLTVCRVLVVVDREQGGEATLKDHRCAFESLYCASEMMRYYAATGRIDEPTARAIHEHLRQHRFG